MTPNIIHKNIAIVINTFNFLLNELFSIPFFLILFIYHPPKQALPTLYVASAVRPMDKPVPIKNNIPIHTLVPPVNGATANSADAMNHAAIVPASTRTEFIQFQFQSIAIPNVLSISIFLMLLFVDFSILFIANAIYEYSNPNLYNVLLLEFI